MRCVCFHPPPPRSHWAIRSPLWRCDVVSCLISQTESLFFVLRLLFLVVLSFFLYLPVSPCFIQLRVSWAAMIVRNGLLQPWLETLRWGLDRKNSKGVGERERRGRSQRQFILERERALFFRTFPDLTLSSFWQGQYGSENVSIVRSTGLRRGRGILVLWINSALHNFDAFTVVA